jgi:Arc/MetJ family transcription regulator
MRTTIGLDDDILARVKFYAESRSLSVERAVAELLRRGLSAELPTRVLNGVCVFDLPPDSPVVTSKRVRELAWGM